MSFYIRVWQHCDLEGITQHLLIVGDGELRPAYQEQARQLNISDRVHVLQSGRTLPEGPPAEVRSNPAVIEAYLGVHGSQEAGRAFD